MKLHTRFLLVGIVPTNTNLISSFYVYTLSKIEPLESFDSCLNRRQLLSDIAFYGFYLLYNGLNSRK